MHDEPGLNPGSGASQAAPAFFPKWWVAIRPFALPASTMPVIFGTVLAVTVGEASFSLPLFLMAFVAMALLHSGANLLNDVCDYKKGLDRRVNPVSGAVVRGWVTPAQALVASCLFLAAGSLLGLGIIAIAGVKILWLGVLGVAIGVFYSLGPVCLKFHALGDLAVFLNFGVLGALGAWTVQTGHYSWVPAVWAVPMSLLVSAILHANNWRDIATDSNGEIRTMASLFGDRASQAYYGFLIFGPFAIIVALVALSWGAGLAPRMPATFLITLLALPVALKLMRKGRRRHNAQNPIDFLALDGATAQLNLLFGLLCTAALGLDALIGWVLG